MEIKNAFATFLFIENWYLAMSGSDYLRQGESKSLFQQFWALSVQVQLYLLIPIVYLYSKKLGEVLGQKNLVVKVLVGISICSFSYSLYSTFNSPQSAYFDTFARLWEFTIGLLLFHVSSKIVISVRVSTALNVIAIISIVSFGLFWGNSYPLPGFVALIPVISACTIIVSSKSLNFSILRWPIFTKLGDYSFAFYLWHWPIYLVLLHYTNIDASYDVLGFLVILVSLILAFVSTEYLEKPFRSNSSLVKSDKKTYLYSFIAMLLPGAFALTTLWTFKTYEKPAKAALYTYYNNKILPGVEGSQLFPHGTVIKQDMRASYFNSCEQNMRDTGVIECEYGNRESNKVIALVGGSHAAQWISPLKEIALEQGFKIHLMIKSACSLTQSADEFYTPSQSCLDWNINLEKRLIELQPSYIMTTVSRNGPLGERIPEGYVQSWLHLKRELTNTKLVGIRDNPWFKFDPPLCIEINGPDRCATTRKSFYNDKEVLPLLTNNIDVTIDFSNEFCRDGVCSTVLDNGLIKFKDKHHLTKSYALFLKQELAKVIKEM